MMWALTTQIILNIVDMSFNDLEAVCIVILCILFENLSAEVIDYRITVLNWLMPCPWLILMQIVIHADLIER